MGACFDRSTARAGRLLVGCLLLAGACGAPQPDEVLRLRQVHPSGGRLFLNQEIVFVFDRAIDPSSVTESTIRIVDEADLPVNGRRRVRSFTVHFEPIVPTDAELSNGSFQPGKRYTCELRSFPRAHAVRGARGEVLVEADVRSLQAVSPDALPEGFPSPFLPTESGRGYFVLLPRAVVGVDGAWFDIRFNRPVYPPSARPSAFRLFKVGQPGGDPSPLRSVEVLRQEGPGGYGSVLRLYPGRKLDPGHYKLALVSGAQGVQDYALENPFIPSLRPPTGGGAAPGFEREGLLEFYVDPSAVPALFRQDFESRRSPLDRREILDQGLPVELEGVLVWGPHGLYWPQLAFPDFQSLGDLRPENNVVLKASSIVELTPGRPVKLPEGSWDLDRVVIPKGVRCFVTLDRLLRLRVAGGFEVAGELLFRLGSGEAPRLPQRPHEGPYRGDPRTVWRRVLPRVEIEVGGLTRLDGRIGLYTEGPPERVPGFLRAREPLLGGWKKSRLEVWLEPSPVGAASGPLLPPSLPGRWGVLSSWYPLDVPQALNRVWMEELASGARLSVWVQGRSAMPGGDLSFWTSPEKLPDLGKLSELRFALVADGRTARPGVLLRAIGFW